MPQSERFPFLREHRLRRSHIPSSLWKNLVWRATLSHVFCSLEFDQGVHNSIIVPFFPSLHFSLLASLSPWSKKKVMSGYLFLRPYSNFGVVGDSITLRKYIFLHICFRVICCTCGLTKEEHSGGQNRCYLSWIFLTFSGYLQHFVLNEYISTSSFFHQLYADNFPRAPK